LPQLVGRVRLSIYRFTLQSPNFLLPHSEVRMSLRSKTKAGERTCADMQKGNPAALRLCSTFPGSSSSPYRLYCDARITTQLSCFWWPSPLFPYSRRRRLLSSALSKLNLKSTATPQARPRPSRQQHLHPATSHRSVSTLTAALRPPTSWPACTPTRQANRGH